MSTYDWSIVQDVRSFTLGSDRPTKRSRTSGSFNAPDGSSQITQQTVTACGDSINEDEPAGDRDLTVTLGFPPGLNSLGKLSTISKSYRFWSEASGWDCNEVKVTDQKWDDSFDQVKQCCQELTGFQDLGIGANISLLGFGREQEERLLIVVQEVFPEPPNQNHLVVICDYLPDNIKNLEELLKSIGLRCPTTVEFEC
jgi:hypothetical protein